MDNIVPLKFGVREHCPREF